MPSRIDLITCIGVKSSPHLIAHFVEHYQTLGVQRLLIILHAEKGDPRADAIKQQLALRRVEPVRMVEEFSAALKHRYAAEIVAQYSDPDSWILYADVDEFQMYAGGLIPYLERCERWGQSFARGRMIDRLAPSGALIPIEPVPALWKQFPESRPVTREIARGWDLKVAAARAAVALGDGGAHTIAYGLPPIWNYRLTHMWPRFREERVEIYHFKWDATLPQRLREKLEGTGGDRDRWDGIDFMDEYRRLDDHLRRFGRINMGDS